MNASVEIFRIMVLKMKNVFSLNQHHVKVNEKSLVKKLTSKWNYYCFFRVTRNLFGQCRYGIS